MMRCARNHPATPDWASPALRRITALLAVLPLLLTVADATADQVGPIITEIRILGNESIDGNKIKAKMLSRVGRPFDISTIQVDQHALHKTKWFADVKIVDEKAPDNKGVILTVVVQESPVLTAVEFRGRTNLKLKTIEENTGLKVGERADHVKNQAAVNQIRRLYEEEGYDRAEVVLLEGGKPGDRKAIFQIYEGPKVKNARITFTGNSFVTDATLRTKIGSRTPILGFFGGKSSEEVVDEDVRKLTEYYVGLGFFEAKISPIRKPLDDLSQVELEFVINEGQRFTVREIKFEGNEKLTTEALMKGMNLKDGKFFTDAMKVGDAKTLQSKYTAIGCIDVQIMPEPKITETPGVVDLAYRIDEGESYNVGMINVRGNGRTRDKVIRRELLMSGLAPGEPLDGTKLDTARTRISNLGFFHAGPEAGGKPIEIKIVNRRPYDQPFPEVANVDFDDVVRAGLSGPEPISPPLGNVRGKDKKAAGEGPVTITRFYGPEQDPVQVPPLEEPLAPGTGPAAVVPFGSRGVFNPQLDAPPVIPAPPASGPGSLLPRPGSGGRGALNNGSADQFPSLPGENMTDVGPDRQEPFSNRGIANIASQVDPGPAPTNNRPFADIDVGVDEAPTGRIAFGVGATSYGGLSGNFILHEKNFDLFNIPRSFGELTNGGAFRGAGQELRIEASPGTLINRFVVSFREPYLFDLPIGLGASGYVFGRQYPDFFERRGGGRFSLGRQFGTQIYADVAARVENVDISGLRFPAPADFLAMQGQTFLASLRPSLRFDNRNHPFTPTQGQYLELAFEQGWGTFTFPKVTAEGRTHFTLWERPDQTGKQTLTFRGFFGAAGRDTPSYERFYAGDFRSMRGFAYRGVGPRVFGQNVGGIFTVVGSAEYQFPITASDKLQMVVFSDFGTVESDFNISDFRASVGTGLRVTIPALGPLPLAFDLAYPVSKVEGPNGDRTRYFTFFIGAFW